MANMTVTMSDEEWMKILTMLADFPFKQSAQIIQLIQRQLQLQAEQTQRDQAINTPRINGSDQDARPGA